MGCCGAARCTYSTRRAIEVALWHGRVNSLLKLRSSVVPFRSERGQADKMTLRTVAHNAERAAALVRGISTEQKITNLISSWLAWLRRLNLIDSAIQFILQVIAQIGYPGIVGLMALERVGLPIPSEVIMPASGWLASEGMMNLFLVTAAGTLGCVAGSIAAYWIGLKGGRAAVKRYGCYVFLNEGHLDAAERWFHKYGAWAIFLTRLMPIVRTYISFPAGMARMRFWPFIALSAAGSALWCFILAYIGYLLGPDWSSISGNFNLFTVVVLVAVGLVLIMWYYRRRRMSLNKTE